MKNTVFLSSIAVCALILFAGAGRSDAVIYQYTDESGNPALVDELEKVPERFRTSAKMVSGQVTTERTEDELQRDARMAVSRREAAEQERAASRTAAETSKRNRFLLSGCVVAGVVIVLLVMANLHVLQQYSTVTRRVRSTLLALLVVYLGIMHARDVLSLFSKASEGIQGVQDEQAKKGKKAAEFYKALDQVLDQKVREAQEAARKGEEEQAQEK